jgi:protein-S-isoprenylcysteine O-methyltransferase Ste14
MVRASAFEFRFRFWLMVAVIFVGFWSPWIEWLHLGTRGTAWLWLGFQLGGLGVAAGTAIELVTIAAIVLAALAAWLRIWGTAYLGPATVLNTQMQAGKVMPDGPYRRMRNPLYLGSFFMVAVIALLMPASGAAFTLVILAVFLLRLILAEEAFLSRQIGPSYDAYRRAVPRLIPSVFPRAEAGGNTPHWGRAIVNEITPLGVLVSFAALSWQYNAGLLTRAVLISFGLSLVVRALTMPRDGAATPVA